MTQYLRRPCSGCGAKIEVEQPQQHVHSAHTGNNYCKKCARYGLPPENKRPKLDEQVTTNERSKIRMATKQTEKAEKSTEVLDALLERVKTEIPNVDLIPKNGYVIVKADGKTIGYVAGKHKVRIEGFVKGGAQPTLTISTMSEIDKGFEILKSGVELRQQSASERAAAEQERAAKRERAAAEKKAKLEADAEKAKSEPVPPAEPSPDDDTVKPDPKPVGKKRAAKS